jgi:hypothetical protein
MKLGLSQTDWKPTRRDKLRLAFGFSAFFYLVAAMEFMWPSPHSDRYTWLYRLLPEPPALSGYFVSMVVAGTVCLIAGIYHLKEPQ